MALQAQAATSPVPSAAATKGSNARLIPLSLLMLCAAIVLASFLKPDLTQNDFERFHDLRLLFLFFALFVGLSGVYVAAYTQPQSPSRQAVLIIAAVAAALLLASFPVGSKDVFAYVFYGKIWGWYHANPYTATPADFPLDPWQPYIQARWRNMPTAYGPLFLWQSWLVNAVAGGHLWLAVWLHKCLATLLLLGTWWLAAALVRQEPAGVAARLLMLFAWNPLFLFESASGAHNDIAMVLLLLGALLCWRAGRFGTALLLLALSFWYKWYSIIFLPAFLLETLKTFGVARAARQALIWVAVTAALGIVLLAPLPGALATITGQLLHPGALQGIFPNELSPPLAVLFWSLRGLGLFESDVGFQIFHAGRFVMFGLAVVIVFIRQWTAQAGFGDLVESCFLLGCAFFLLLVTMLLPWHLLIIIACGLLCAREPFIGGAVVLTVLGLLSYFLTFAVASLMLALIGGALWLLRRPQRPTLVHPD